MVGVCGPAPLTKSLNSGDRFVRFSAALALTSRAEEFGLPVLLDELSGDWPGPELRKAGADAVAKLPGVRNLEPLLQHLSDRDADLRAAIIQALARVDDPELLSKLIGAVHGNTSDRISGILDALDARRVGLTVPVLTPLLEEQGWEGSQLVRARGPRLLGRLGSPAAVTPIGRLVLNDPDDGVRAAAAEALACLDPCLAAGSLVLALSGYGLYVDRVVVPALASMPGSCVTNALVRGLRNEESSVRVRCATALGQRRDSEAVEPLLAVVQADTTDEFLRLEATLALSTFRDRRVLPVILKNLRDPQSPWDLEIDRLIRAIAQIGDLSAVEPLLALAANRDWRQQQRAFDALRALTGQTLGPDLKAWQR